MSADPRSRAQRRRDTEHRLTHDIDVRVASASADRTGSPYGTRGAALVGGLRVDLKAGALAVRVLVPARRQTQGRPAGGYDTPVADD